MVRGGRSAVAGLLQLGACDGWQRLCAQRRGRGVGARTSRSPESSRLCPFQFGALVGGRRSGGDHSPDARLLRAECHHLCRQWCALRHQFDICLGRQDFRNKRGNGSGSGCCRSYRYQRSSTPNPGIEQPAAQRRGSVVRDIRRKWFCSTFAGLALNMNVRIAAAAFSVPFEDETVESVLDRERDRVETTLAPLSPKARQKATEGLGLSRVRVCGSKQPYDLVLEAASAAMTEAGITGQDVNLILDYSTFPGENSQYFSCAHNLSDELGAETSLNLSFKSGGCAALHLAIKTALGWMGTDESIQTALLVTGDSAPKGSRSLLPITVQGDAASAVILRREGAEGPLLLSVEAMTLGHLHEAIALIKTNGHLEIKVDAACMENEVMPVYYLNLLWVVQKALAGSSLTLKDIDHFIYSNISQRDRDGFRRMVGLPEGGLPPTPMAEYGHTFASDLIINYVHLRREGRISPGQLLLFASAGIGFTWGVTLARA